MRKALSVGMVLTAALAMLAKDIKRPPTEQIQRGHDLFVNSPKGIACANCHEMAGEGTAVGPDLTTMGSMGTPHVIVMTMHMTMTNYVQTFRTTLGTYPGMLKGKDNGVSEIWDLSKLPPVLRKVPNSEILSVDRDQAWKHPPASVEYTPQEYADLIAFLHWAATGSTKEVKADEVADLK